MHISQNSSAFGDVRCVIAHAAKDLELQESSRSGGHTPVSVAQMMKVCAAPDDVEGTMPCLVLTTTFKFDDNCFWLSHCVSAADRMQFFADAQLLPNMRTQI
jgi:hypothetical protein